MKNLNSCSQLSFLGGRARVVLLLRDDLRSAYKLLLRAACVEGDSALAVSMELVQRKPGPTQLLQDIFLPFSKLCMEISNG